MMKQEESPARQTVSCNARGVVTRLDANGEPQTLVLVSADDKDLVHYLIRPLGGGGSEPFALGPPLKLTHGAGSQLPYGFESRPGSPVYEPASNCVYWIEGHAIMRMDDSNVVTRAAGERLAPGNADGRRHTARFTAQDTACGLTTDLRGALYITDNNRIAKVEVTVDTARVSTCFQAGAAGGAAATNPVSMLAYDTRRGALLAASRRAVYHMQPSPAVGAPHALQPKLIVRAASSAFGSRERWHGLVADRNGDVYLLWETYFEPQHLQKLDVAACTLSTVIDNVDRFSGGALAILPGGYLALCCSRLMLVRSEGLLPPFDPSLRPPPDAADASAPPAGAAEPVAQLSVLLQDTMVAVAVSGATFHVHRSLLTDRSDYCARRLSGRRPKAGPARLELPAGVKPEAFGCLLAALYRGRLHVPDALLRPVAELAGLLQLPEVLSRLQPRLLAATTPASVVADALWAERHGLGGLLLALREYFMRHGRRVAEEVPDWAAQLIVGSPALAAELLAALAARA